MQTNSSSPSPSSYLGGIASYTWSFIPETVKSYLIAMLQKSAFFLWEHMPLRVHIYFNNYMKARVVPDSATLTTDDKTELSSLLDSLLTQELAKRNPSHIQPEEVFQSSGQPFFSPTNQSSTTMTTSQNDSMRPR